MTFFEQVKDRLTEDSGQIIVKAGSFAGTVEPDGFGTIRVKYAAPIGFKEVEELTLSSYISDYPKRVVSSSVETLGTNKRQKIMAVVDGSMRVSEGDLEHMADGLDTVFVQELTVPCDEEFKTKLNMILNVASEGEDIKRLLTVSLDKLKDGIAKLASLAIVGQLSGSEGSPTILEYDVKFYVKPKPGAKPSFLSNLERLAEETQSEWELVREPWEIVSELISPTF